MGHLEVGILQNYKSHLTMMMNERTSHSFHSEFYDEYKLVEWKKSIYQRALPSYGLLYEEYATVEALRTVHHYLHTSNPNHCCLFSTQLGNPLQMVAGLVRCTGTSFPPQCSLASIHCFKDSQTNLPWNEKTMKKQLSALTALHSSL